MELYQKMLIGFTDWTHFMPMDKTSTNIIDEAKKRALIAEDFAVSFALWLDKHYFQHQTKKNCYAKSEIDFTTDKVFTVEQLIEKFKRLST